jgi:DNA-binding FrmR family transcriptional regulator
MAHTIREKSKLLARVRRIRGQVEAIERALEREKGCAEVMHLVAAARGAMNGFMGEIVEDHIRLHVCDPATDSDRERADSTGELLEVLRTYLK